MKYFKDNKWVIIPVLAFVIVIIFAVIGIINFVMPNSSKNLYGNRLEDIENNVIKDETVNLIKEELMKTEKIEDVNYDLKGKLVNFIITVKNDVDKLTAVNLTDKIVSGFDDNIKNFYDIQVFIKTTEENEIFPIIGYKHTSSVNFVWNN